MSRMLARVLHQVLRSHRFNFGLLVFLFLSVSLCFFQQTSQGLAPTSKSTLIDQAQALNLDKSRQWIRLNHYRKSLLGFYQSIVRGGFFLHPQGAEDPKAELESTIEKMFSSDSALRKQTQCKYLARRDFLATQLKIAETELEVCSFSNEWLTRLGAQQVSLVFASSFMNSAGSSFGHTFLKLNNPKNQGALELTDYGVNFSARAKDTDGAMYAINGLLGNFPGTFAMLPFHQMMKDYLNLEGRDLWEYKLSLNSEEVRRLLFALLELEGTYFDYYFLDDNCAFQILKLLEIAKPELELVADDELFVIPLDTVKRVHRVAGLVVSESHRSSLQAHFRSSLAVTSRESLAKIRDLVAQAGPSDRFEVLSTNELDLTQYYLALKQIEEPKSAKIWQEARDRVSRSRARRVERASPVLDELSPDSLQPRTLLQAPQDAPDSSLIGLGGFEKDHQQGAELYWRFAFHDLLESDEGAAKWSELEVLSFRLRKGSSAVASERAYVDEIRILSMLSTSSVNLLFQPLSWGVRVGAFQNGEDLGHLSPLLQMKAGNSLDILTSDFRWCLFAKGSAQEQPDLRLGIGVGGESFLLARFSDKIHGQMGFEKLFFRKWDFQSTQVRGIAQITRQLALAAEYKENMWAAPNSSATWTDDKALRLQYLFLF